MRLCVMCEFFRVSPGHPGYSDVTPGYDATIECGNWKEPARWKMNNMDTTTGAFRLYIMRAETCPSYSPASIDVEDCHDGHA